MVGAKHVVTPLVSSVLVTAYNYANDDHNDDDEHHDVIGFVLNNIFITLLIYIVSLITNDLG